MSIDEASSNRSLTQDDKVEVFKLATRSIPRRHADKIANGMSDDELEELLKLVLGIYGGSSAPDRLSVVHQGSGLKIWGGWHIINPYEEGPLFQGKATIAMAREVYGIADPSNDQMSLI